MKRAKVFSLFILLTTFSWAGGVSHFNVSISSIDTLLVKIKGNGYKIPYFDKELVDGETGLPLFVLEKNLSCDSIVTNLIVQPIEFVELLPADSCFSFNVDSIKEFSASWSVSEDRSNRIIKVWFNTVFSKSGKIYVVKSFDVKMSLEPIKNNSFKSVSAYFAEESVLSQGKWVKVKIEKTGIYQLDYATLSSWGFTNPQKVKIYGNGGDMLPKSNGSSRFDDLIENSVYDNGNALLFYAKGVVNWNYNSSKSLYQQVINDYDKTSYYYITESDRPRQVLLKQSDDLIPSQSFNHFVSYDYFEKNSQNLLRSGSQWLGDQFVSTSLLFSTPNIITSKTESIRASVGVVARSDNKSIFEVFVNGSLNPDAILYCFAVPLGSTTELYADSEIGYLTSSSYNNSVQFDIKYEAQTTSSVAWLDFVTLNYDRSLIFDSNELYFRQPSAKGNTEFRISGAQSKNIVILDVTNATSPLQMKTSTSFDTIRFVADCDTLREFVAFNPNAVFLSPSFVENVTNQNLHGMPQTDYIIVTPNEFLREALNLADIHNRYNNITPTVVTTEQIYNEFSSGKQDPIAIRSLMRMLYSRAKGDSLLMPKYLLLYGDGSYDNLGVVSKNKSKIVTFQSPSSLHQTESYVTDDIFGFLDDSEGNNNLSDLLDIGIGRFVINDLEEARIANSKVLAYLTEQDNSDWKTFVTFLAQDGDNNLHQRDAEDLSVRIRTYNPEFSINKIYADAYKKVTSSQFANFPEADKAINDALVTNGTLIFNYTGHGSVTATAYGFLNISKVDKLNNIRRLPLFVTATCDISRFDNPDEKSMGEHVFLNPIGGGIGLVSTTRIVYSYFNKNLNLNFYKNAFLKDVNGSPLRIGEVMRRTKNSSIASVNKLNFTLLCDPGLQLTYPKNSSVINEIKNVNIESVRDTLNGLTHGRISGDVRDQFGTLLSDYNGSATITLYDKISKVKTLGNSGQTPFEYESYENVLYRGKVNVESGLFNAEFIVPQDVRYDFGYGKFSLFTTNENSNTSFGVHNGVVIGDLDAFAGSDDEGPSVDLFLNSYSFKNGGKTGVAPLFIANLYDVNSINTAGSGIGHDLLLTIDGQSILSFIVNDFFEFNKDSYQYGVIKYQLPSLPPGNHQITFKGWDSYNNSTLKSLDFQVVADGDLGVENISLYPNPIKESQTMKIYFNHDEPNSTFNIEMTIFTIDGLLVNQVEYIKIDHNGLLPFIEWQPETISGSPLGEGIYVCRLVVNSSTGQHTVFSKRFAILK